MREIKICIIAAGGVGKSPFTVQFVQGIFVAKYDPTIEDSYRKVVEVDGKQVVLEVLDTAGTELFTAMRAGYIKHSQGIILMYSIIAESTFRALNDLYEEVVRVKDTENFPLLVVGNKCDLADQRVIPAEEGRKLAEKWNAGFIEASAFSGTNVAAAFEEITRRVLKSEAAAEARKPAAPTKVKEKKTDGGGLFSSLKSKFSSAKKEKSKPVEPHRAPLTISSPTSARPERAYAAAVEAPVDSPSTTSLSPSLLSSSSTPASNWSQQAPMSPAPVSPPPILERQPQTNPIATNPSTTQVRANPPVPPPKPAQQQMAWAVTRPTQPQPSEDAPTQQNSSHENTLMRQDECAQPSPPPQVSPAETAQTVATPTANTELKKFKGVLLECVDRKEKLSSITSASSIEDLTSQVGATSSLARPPFAMDIWDAEVEEYIALSHWNLVESNQDKFLKLKIVPGATSPPPRSRPAEPARQMSGESFSQTLVSRLDKRWIIEYSALTFVKHLGNGAFGTVDLCKWRGSFVAVKRTIASRLSENESRKFLAEIELMLEMQAHPNVVGVYGIACYEDQLFIVLPYCSWGSLDKFIQDHDLSWLQKARILLDVANGLSHLHHSKIIHRDIAARNVLLAEGGAAKLADFGLSRQLTDDKEYGHSKGLEGPLRWFPPEAYTNGAQTVKFSPASDMHMFGMTMYEVLAEEVPFAHLDLLGAWLEVRSGARPQLPPGCPPDLFAIAQFCWRADPASRPTAAQAAMMLERWIESAEKPPSYTPE